MRIQFWTVIEDTVLDQHQEGQWVPGPVSKNSSSIKHIPHTMLQIHQRSQKHTPAFQTISQRRRHTCIHSTRITEYTLLHAAHERRGRQSTSLSSPPGLTKKLASNCMPSKKSWISLKKYQLIPAGTLEEKALEIMEVLWKQLAYK